MHELVEKLTDNIDCDDFRYHSDEMNKLITDWLEEKAECCFLQAGQGYCRNDFKEILGIKEESLEEKIIGNTSYKDIAQIAKQHYKDNPSELED